MTKTIEQSEILKIINMLDSEDQEMQELGMTLSDNMLKNHHILWCNSDRVSYDIPITPNDYSDWMKAISFHLTHYIVSNGY